MKRFITLLSAVLLASNLLASNSRDTSIKIPIQRQIFHDKINETQKLFDVADGKVDSIITVGNFEDINLQISDAIFRKVDILQDSIELNKKITTNNEKVRFLIFLDNILRQFYQEWRSNKINPVFGPMLVENFSNIFQATADSQSMAPMIADLPFPISNILVSKLDLNVVGYREASKINYLKLCKIDPDKILQNVGPFVAEPFIDSLLNETCKNDPTQVYNFAQNLGSPGGQLVHNSTNPIAKTIVTLSHLPAALLYFPFLDDIVSGKKSIDSLKTIIGEGMSQTDSIAYFKLLVKTEIEYSKRMSRGDTAVAFFGANGLRDMLRVKDSAHFINWINALHERPENIRMKALDDLSSIEIYYVIVMGEDDIYTSSYKHSFTRLIQRLGKKVNTDSLLVAVNFDFFKKFIKMAANFNRLDTFLNMMPPDRAEFVMRSFVDNLETTNSLEDAVDVADCFSSISNKKLQTNILNYVKENEKRVSNTSNIRGQIIYSILKTIFLSADSSNKVDLASAIGIPPIYSIDNKALMDTAGRIVQQVFFYGDEDGKAYYPQFMSSFSGKDWVKNESNPEWVEIRSTGAEKILIFVNRPLSSDANLDDSAQVHLNNYLRKRGLKPTIVTHRGHSYWLPGTMDRMAGDAKIVVLGSCGGYKNLSHLIEINPEAHIISTKEIGTGNINQIVTNTLNDVLLSGKDIVWKNMWSGLSRYFSKQSREMQEYWEDYVPPYKNLGAIFIKAYNKKMEAEVE